MSLATQSETARQLVTVLQRHLGPLTAQTVVDTSCSRAHLSKDLLRPEQVPSLVPELEKGLKLFLRDPFKQQSCLGEVEQIVRKKPAQPLAPSNDAVAIRDDRSLLEARSLARQRASELGFSVAAQTQVATVVSELARNILKHAGAGTVTVACHVAGRVRLEVIAEDHGPGIPDVQAFLDGARRSKTGLGVGLRGSRNLMDRFEVETSLGHGTRIVAVKERR